MRDIVNPFVIMKKNFNEYYYWIIQLLDLNQGLDLIKKHLKKMYIILFNKPHMAANAVGAALLSLLLLFCHCCCCFFRWNFRWTIETSI